MPKRKRNARTLKQENNRQFAAWVAAHPECAAIDDQAVSLDAIRGVFSNTATATQAQHAMRDQTAELEDRYFLLECYSHNIPGAYMALEKIVKQIDARLKAD